MGRRQQLQVHFRLEHFQQLMPCQQDLAIGAVLAIMRMENVSPGQAQPLLSRMWQAWLSIGHTDLGSSGS